MIFVDTSAWFASIVPTDIDHFAASQWLSQNQQTLITTDFMIDEIFIFKIERAHYN